MSLVNSEGVTTHLENSSQSLVQKHESSDHLRPAFQKAIERAADKQASADRAARKEIGINEAACHSVLDGEVLTTPAGDHLAVQTSASSAHAHLSGEMRQDYFSEASRVGESSVGELSTWSSGLSASHSHKVTQSTDVPSLSQTPLTELMRLKTPLDHSLESAQANGISPASQRIEPGDSRSIDTQGVVQVDDEDHSVASSELMAFSQSITSSQSAAPIAWGGFDQQAFDTLSHLLLKQNSLDDSQTHELVLKVIAGMPGVESLHVQQDQSGQWHVQLQLNPNSSRPEEQHRAQLLAELTRRGHTMGSINIFQPAGSALFRRGDLNE